jgi:uncharacterized membrane protein
MLKIPFLSKKDFFSTEEKNRIVSAIREAEKQTSGEIRVYVESRCRFVEALDRAAEVFTILKMGETTGHNAVLIYLAVKDRQLAIFGDSAIHEKVGEEFWRNEVIHMLTHFQNCHYADATVKVHEEIIIAFFCFHLSGRRRTEYSCSSQSTQTGE